MQADSIGFGKGDYYKIIPRSEGLDMAVPTKEFLEYMKENRIKNTGVDSYFQGDATAPRQARDLTEQELSSLGVKYNPENMNEAEYRSFVDDLISMGVLGKADTNFIDYSKMVCLGTPENMHLSSGASARPADGRETMDTLADAKGNVLEWARQKSSWEALVDQTGHRNLFTERSSTLFARIFGVLDSMQTIQKNG